MSKLHMPTRDILTIGEKLLNLRHSVAVPAIAGGIPDSALRRRSQRAGPADSGGCSSRKLSMLLYVVAKRLSKQYIPACPPVNSGFIHCLFQISTNKTGKGLAFTTSDARVIVELLGNLFSYTNEEDSHRSICTKRAICAPGGQRGRQAAGPPHSLGHRDAGLQPVPLLHPRPGAAHLRLRPPGGPRFSCLYGA